MMRMLLLLGSLLLSAQAQAGPAEAWNQAMQDAAAGRIEQAISRLSGAEQVLPAGDLWRDRMHLGRELLRMRSQGRTDLGRLGIDANPVQLRLMQRYVQEHRPPESGSTLWPGLLAAVLPGAGHAWQHRWRDAAVAAALVWPMLMLTLWAARRRMGPVTVFFAMITVWLWSGTVFSAVSLAERGDFEAYLGWWQGLWQAAALPGRPW